MIGKVELLYHRYPCHFKDCSAGYFLWKDQVCFMTEYFGNMGGHDAYNEAGEYFWGDAKTIEERDNLIVQPMRLKKIQLEE